tara:strand:+ start:786 stop:1547 length:762 start_codon:yes stop_codon:yes gene_type:complete
MKNNKKIELLINHRGLMAYSILIAILTIASFQWANYRKIFELGELSISGENFLAKSEYNEIIGSIDVKSIKGFDIEDLSERLELNPFVKAVRVSKHYPGAIKIEIVEREPIAIINNKVQLMIDDNAIVLPNNTTIENSLIPVLSGFNPATDLYPLGQITYSIKVKEAIEILAYIKNNYSNFYDEISELTINKDDEYEIILSEEPTRVILGKNNISKKIKILKNFDKALGQRQLTSYRLLDMRYSKQLIAMEWT